MKRLAGLSLCCLSIVVSGFAQPKKASTPLNSLTSTEKKEGWILLFDGKTTKGWHTYGASTAGEAWNVQDNALHLKAEEAGDTKGHGDLVTNGEYDNYHLKLEWKISPKGNSGIIFYIHEDKAKYPQTYNSGLEMQVIDNDGHADAKINKHRAGDLYDLIACSQETVKPVGEWNEAEIRSKNGNLELFLNGAKVITTTLWNDQWKQMVAGSKFKTMPGFGIYKKGKISLQDHHNEVWYRNIRIRKL